MLIMSTIILIMSISDHGSGLANALFTRVQQRVLGLLYGNTGRSYYVNEIIRLSGMGSRSVQRELGKLANAGLVTVTQQGNQKHYRANPDSAVFSELRGLILKTVGLVDVLRVALEPMTEHITTAFVYGSVAKGEDTATSDIDLMVISDSLTHVDLFAVLEEATQALGRTVNPTMYTPEEFQKRRAQDSAFVRRVMDQPKLWIMEDKDDLGTGQSLRSG